MLPGPVRVSVLRPPATLNPYAPRLQYARDASGRDPSDPARFLLCAHCGVLVAVVFEHEGRRYGAANATSLDARDGFAPAVPASPQQLGRDDKVARWLRLWVPDVVLRTDATLAPRRAS